MKSILFKIALFTFILSAMPTAKADHIGPINPNLQALVELIQRDKALVNDAIAAAKVNQSKLAMIKLRQIQVDTVSIPESPSKPVLQNRLVVAIQKVMDRSIPPLGKGAQMENLGRELLSILDQILEENSRPVDPPLEQNLEGALVGVRQVVSLLDAGELERAARKVEALKALLARYPLENALQGAKLSLDLMQEKLLDPNLSLAEKAIIVDEAANEFEAAVRSSEAFAREHVPVERQISLVCESREFKHTNCSAGGLRITRVVLAARYSNKKCILNSSFGINGDNTAIWVDGGCRGLFTVSGF